MTCQEVLKALIKVLDNNEEEKNFCLGVKKPAAQVPSLANSILVPRAGQPASSGVLSPTTPSGRFYVDIKNDNIYEEFMTADNEM